MSREQPQRPQDDQFPQQEPIKYGDVFYVSGELASKPITPRDAAAMQAAENMVLGTTQRGGPAAVMESAAALNERAGLVGHRDSTNVARDQGVSVSETFVEGNRIIREAVGGQVVGEYVKPEVRTESPGAVREEDLITIGEALEATAFSAPDKAIDQSDAAAIQAAEMRAIGVNITPPDGIGAEAQSAATLNTRVAAEEFKMTFSDVLGNATEKLKADKAVTREDAEGVIGAEVRNKVDMSTTPGGVAASIAAAARLNQNK
ncbi:hypothetical protein UlMin_031447 [Ulmus minor]